MSLLDWRPGRSAQPGGPPYKTYGDTVIVVTDHGPPLVRARAVLYVLRSLGSGWKLVALLGRLVPTPLADRAYDWVARHRHCTLSR